MLLRKGPEGAEAYAQGANVNSALAHLRNKRPVVEPNWGFLEQLRALDATNLDADVDKVKGGGGSTVATPLSDLPLDLPGAFGVRAMRPPLPPPAAAALSPLPPAAALATLHRDNRRRLVDTFLAGRGGGGGSAPVRAVLMFKGGTSSTRHDTDHEPVFRQESFFAHLFGVREPDFYAVVALPTGETTLFCPRRSEDYTVVMGAPR